MDKKILRLISRNEEIILMAIWKLKGNAYGVTIRDYASDLTGVPWKFGSVYVPLDKLTLKGYIRKYHSSPVLERGGRSKVMYELTSTGKEALKQVKKVQDALWDKNSNLIFD
ncbi:PadR family transcriptional regulator [Acidobacteriota bacterium]